MNSNLSNLGFLNTETIDGYAIININGGYNFDNYHCKQEGLKYLINLINDSLKLSKKYNRDKIIINIFLDRYSGKNISSDYITTIANTLNILFDGKVERCNLINASDQFKDIINLIKPMINPKIRNNIFNNC